MQFTNVSDANYFHGQVFNYVGFVQHHNMQQEWLVLCAARVLELLLVLNNAHNGKVLEIHA